MMDNYFENPEQTCRICYTINTESEPLFENEDLLNNVLEFLQFELIDQKQLPKAICKSCKSKTIIYVDFRRECQQNNERLLAEYEKLDLKVENLESIEEEHHLDNDYGEVHIFKEEYKIDIIPGTDTESTKSEQKDSDDNEIVFVEKLNVRKSSRRIRFGKKRKGFRKVYSCIHCNKIFKEVSAYNHHVNTHTGENPYKCKECDAAYPNPYSLKYHMARQHEERKSYKCETCEKEFSSGQSLKNHLHLHTEQEHFECDCCNKIFTAERHYKYHMKTHLLKPYQCDYCGKRFLTRVQLKFHFHSHTGEKSYQCEWCPKAFALAGNLARHRRIHTKEKPYKCELCSLRFTYAKALKYHLNNHDDPKPYQCSMCPEAFTTAASLHSHGRAHMGEYKCAVCELEFTKKIELIKHERTVHREIRIEEKKLKVVEKPFKCDLCPQSFSKEATLIKHGRFHTKDNPYQCLLCNLRYTTYNAIRYHLKSHSNDKDYKCDQCDKAYKTACNLVRHRKSSGHIKLHSCKLCDVKFETSGLLLKHNRREHSVPYVKKTNRTYKTKRRLAAQALLNRQITESEQGNLANDTQLI